MAVIDINQDNFESIIHTDEVVCIEFGADWCAPCKQFARVFEAVAAETQGVVFGKIDVDSAQELSDSFNIRSIPHLLIFKQGIVIYSDSGNMPKSGLLDLINQANRINIEPIKQQLERQHNSED